MARVRVHVGHNDARVRDKRIGAHALALDGLDGDARRAAVVWPEHEGACAVGTQVEAAPVDDWGSGLLGQEAVQRAAGIRVIQERRDLGEVGHPPPVAVEEGLELLVDVGVELGLAVGQGSARWSGESVSRDEGWWALY